MSPRKSYRPWNPDQGFLLPPSPREWLPDDHLVWFVLDLVEQLDLSEIEVVLQAKDPRGNRPFSPRMMTALLLYGYAVGVFSSRKLERATYEDVAFRVLTAGHHPDHWTINEFRKVHREALKALFVQVLHLCVRMGLVKLGLVAIDGSKVAAAASKHKAMSYDRMVKEEKRLAEEIEALLAKAEAADKAEDDRYGNARGDELPEELRRRQSRLAKITETRKALEDEARLARIAALERMAEEQQRSAETHDDAAERKRATTRSEKHSAAAEALGNDDDDDEPPPAPTDLPGHRVDHTAAGKPTPKAQRNFTDPDSRIMKSGGTYVQAYNGQIIADEGQIILAAGVTNNPTDTAALGPMVQRAVNNLDGAVPAKLLGDCGYWSPEGAALCESLGVDPYIAIRRERHGGPAPPGPEPESAPERTETPQERMKRKVQSEEGAALYRRRKVMPEPVFGQIKEMRGFRRFSFRGQAAVEFEWSWVCLAHNALKMWRSEKALPQPV